MQPLYLPGRSSAKIQLPSAHGLCCSRWRPDNGHRQEQLQAASTTYNMCTVAYCFGCALASLSFLRCCQEPPWSCLAAGPVGGIAQNCSCQKLPRKLKTIATCTTRKPVMQQEQVLSQWGFIGFSILIDAFCRWRRQESVEHTGPA